MVVCPNLDDDTSGIPQGSVLGPILFVIYINDLPNEIKSDIYMFADDTKVFRTIKTNDDQYILQDDLDELTAWSTKWLLTFHRDKCKIMHVLDWCKVRDLCSDGKVVCIHKASRARVISWSFVYTLKRRGARTSLYSRHFVCDRHLLLFTSSSTKKQRFSSRVQIKHIRWYIVP